MEQGYIYVANNIYPSLIAISEEEQSKGLMFEPFPPPIMSFIYAHPRINRFWMKNTPSPLDIVFCCDGKIVQICKGEPYSTETIGGAQSDLVIEFPFGTVRDHGIKLGHNVGIIEPREQELKIIVARHAGIL